MNISLNYTAKNNLSFGHNGPVWAIDYDGTYEKFNSALDAKKKYGIGAQSVLYGQSYTNNNKTFVYANNSGVLDAKTLAVALSAFKLGSNQAVYCVYFDGKYQKFKSPKEAAAFFNHNLATVTRSLKDETSGFDGYTFAKAYEVEKRDKNYRLIYDENGNPIVDKNKLNKIRERIIFAKYNYPIAAIDKFGILKIYKNSSEVSKATGHSTHYIRHSMSGNFQSSDYAFFRLSDIVKIDDNGNVEYNEDGSFKIDNEKLKITTK